MKKINLIIILLVAVVFVFIGFKYFDSKKVEDVSSVVVSQKVVSLSLSDDNFNCYNHNEIYKIAGNGFCIISPNNKWIVYASDNGLKLIEVATGIITALSKSSYDRPLAWFSDSQRILGFAGSFPSLDCEGDAIRCPRASDSREIVIWDVKSKTYNSVDVDTPPLSYDLKWIIPDHTALVYAVDMGGTEGDYFLYTLDLDNKTILLTENYRWQPSE